MDWVNNRKSPKIHSILPLKIDCLEISTLIQDTVSHLLPFPRTHCKTAGASTWSKNLAVVLEHYYVWSRFFFHCRSRLHTSIWSAVERTQCRWACIWVLMTFTAKSIVTLAWYVCRALFSWCLLLALRFVLRELYTRFGRWNVRNLHSTGLYTINIESILMEIFRAFFCCCSLSLLFVWFFIICLSASNEWQCVWGLMWWDYFVVSVAVRGVIWSWANPICVIIIIVVVVQPKHRDAAISLMIYALYGLYFFHISFRSLKMPIESRSICALCLLSFMATSMNFM